MAQENPNSAFEPEIVILYCQNSVKKDVDLHNATRKLDGIMVRTFVLPCSSNVEIGHLVKILERGADGIQLVGCPKGLCQFLGGNTKAEKKIEHVKKLLEELNLGGERVAMTRDKELTAELIFDLARERADVVKALGPNCMKNKTCE